MTEVSRTAVKKRPHRNEYRVCHGGAGVVANRGGMVYTGGGAVQNAESIYGESGAGAEMVEE